MIKDYKSFSEEYKSNQIIEYIESSINESIDIKSIAKSTLNKIRGLGFNQQKKVLSYLVATMISIYGVQQTSDYFQTQNIDTQQKEIVKEVIQKEDRKVGKAESPFKKGQDFILSQEGWDDVRDHEKLRLMPYKIGDGKITVGWGHAEDIGKSKYKIGQEITEEEAQKLLKQDLTTAADGVRTIFKQWEDKEIDVPITQDMFDVLVSIAFNSGVGGLRNADFIQDLKKGDYEKAGEGIRNFRSNLFKKYPGLKIRRDKEADKFMSYSKKTHPNIS